MVVIELTTDSPEWQKFLIKYEHMIIHRPEWKQFIEQTFPHTKPKYLAIRHNDELKLIFPIFFQPAMPILMRLITRYVYSDVLVSVPFYDYGGPAGELNLKLLRHIFTEIKSRYYVNFMEIRQGLVDKYPCNIMCRTRLQRFVLLLRSEQEMWTYIHKFKRKAVRRAEKSGISVQEVTKKEISDLYILYLKNMKLFGSLPYSRKYFVNYYKFFVKKNLAKVFGAYYKGKLVAVLMGFTVSNRIHVSINVSDHEYLKFRPNDALHWEFIKWGCNNNFKEFDFGRTIEGRGHFAFKKKWKAELLDLPYYYMPLKHKIPNLAASTLGASYFSILWKKVPYYISARFGPWFRSYFV